MRDAEREGDGVGLERGVSYLLRIGSGGGCLFSS